MLMKLNASVLIAVAAMVGSLNAIGCKSNDAGAEAVAPEENPDTAQVSESTNAANPGTEQDERGFHYWAPHGPPAARFEERGAVRAGHFWSPGYYRWSGREHVWYNGGWYPERPGYTYYGPAWRPEGGRYRYYRGYWRRH